MEETLARIFQFTIAISIAFAVALWFSLSVWAYRDIVRRSENAVVQIMSTLVVVLGFLPGVVVYLLLRPGETLEQRYQRVVEEEYLEQELRSLPACPNCQHAVRDEYLFCPDCGTLLRQACVNCGRLVDANWSICAYCGVDIETSQSAPVKSQQNGRVTSVEPPAAAQPWEIELDADVEDDAVKTAGVENTGDLPRKRFDWETVASSENRDD